MKNDEKRIIENAIEAILFVAGDGVEESFLAEIFEMEKEEFHNVMTEFMDRYNYDENFLEVSNYVKNNKIKKIVKG